MTAVAPEPPPPDDPPAPTGAEAWAPWSAPTALLTALILSFVGGLTVVIAAQAGGVDVTEGDTPPGILLASTAVQDVAFVVVAIAFARMTGPVFAEQFGLRPTRLWPAVGAVVATYIGFAVLVSLWGLLVGDPDEPLLDDLGVDESTLLLVLGIVTVCIGAPLVEELFFRGFFFRALRNRLSLPVAAAATGVIFGVMHLISSPIEAILPLALFGALLCVLYERTGSLYPCIALHAINNSLAFGLNEDMGGATALLVVASLAGCGAIAWAAARRWRPAPA
ncbi:MAG TPA: type II CAAX endopeptidase family protein [Solirubrobacteraceae bacterium]|nr:type II CAAX endopeptidase family protein [Solirubrobacteraceae bacterium]